MIIQLQMSLSSEVQRLRDRINRIAPVVRPPTLGLILTQEGDQRPIEVGPWDLWIEIENNKKADS